MDLRNLWVFPVLMPFLFTSLVSCGSVDSLTSRDLPPAEPLSKVSNGLESVSSKIIGTCEDANLNFRYLSAGGVFDSTDLGNIKTYRLNLFLNDDQTYQIRLMVYDQNGTQFSDDVHENRYSMTATDFMLNDLGTAYVSKADGKTRFILNAQSSRLPSTMNGKQIEMRPMTSPNGLVSAEDFCAAPEALP